MMSFFSHYLGNSDAATTALQLKIKDGTQLHVAALGEELAASDILQERVVALANEIDAVHVAMHETRIKLDDFNRINGNVSVLKTKVIAALQQKQKQDNLAQLNQAFADIDMTADAAVLSEHKNFIRKWECERANLLKEFKVHNISTASVNEVKILYVMALINILKKHEHKKIDLTREYYFKVVMRYIARNKATTSANKELMKSIHVNLGALMLEDNKNVGACLNGKEDAPIQAETKILLDSLRKVLSPGDVNYVLEFITKLTSKSYLNDYLSMVNRIEIVLDKSPIKTVLTTVTRKEQIDHAEYLKQLAEAELSVVNNKFTAAWVKSIFDGADIAGDATVLTGLNLNVVKKIAAIFIQSANPVKQVVDFQTLVTNASGLLQLHEYLTNFIEPVADIKPGSYEQVFAAAEFAMTPELQAYDPAAMVKLVKEFKTGKQHIADLVAQQSQASSQKINKNIDECVANALINSVYRALQLSASPKNLETNRRVLEKLHKLVDTHDSLTNVIHFVISVFDQFENNWARGSDLQRNSLDICLLQLLFNTGTPKGLFESTLAEIQAAYPAHRPSKGVQMSKFPLSDLQGDMVLWLAAPSAGNALRLNHQNCQIVREQTKLNLHSLHSMLQRFKMDATMNVGANSQAEVEEINIFSLIA